MNEAVDPRLVAAAAHVFVDDLAAPDLSAPDEEHLRRSLRLRDGEVVGVSDGDGAWAMCRYRIRGDHGELELDGDVQREGCEGRDAVRVGVAFSLTGAAAAHDVVARLTEIGVDDIAPMVTRRCATRWGPERTSKLELALGRVAREASMVSRRVRLPCVAAVRTFDAILTDWGSRACLAVPRGGDVAPDRTAVLTGPEGGWDPVEEGSGLPRVGLGPFVLRADTAPIVAGALLVSARGQWGNCVTARGEGA